MSFLDVLWALLIAFVLVSCLMLLFAVLGDLLRDGDTGGWAKAGWVLALVLVPFLAALVYLVVRGDAMAARALRRQEQVRRAQESYIRDAAATSAGSSPAEQIRIAEQLAASGAISTEEFERLKTSALA